MISLLNALNYLPLANELASIREYLPGNRAQNPKDFCAISQGAGRLSRGNLQKSEGYLEISLGFWPIAPDDWPKQRIWLDWLLTP